MSNYRYLSTAAAKSTNKNNQGPVLSEVAKRLLKFAPDDKLNQYFQRPIAYCYGNRMIEACSPQNPTPVSLIKTASELHDQLLVRVAHCIYHFQSLPFLPATNPILLSIHDRYRKLFKLLSQFPSIKTDKDEEEFFHTIRMFKGQNQDIIGQLSNGCCEARKHFKSYRIMKIFLDNILHDRLSMRLLCEHYLELHKREKKNIPNDNWRGAICMNFSPAKTVQQCIDDVSSVCFETYGVVPHVHMENHMHETIPFFPDIVEYILRELLKNSVRAIVEYNKAKLQNLQDVKRFFEESHQEPLCKVLITTDPDDEHFTIAIQDLGGGTDQTNEKIFQYLFTSVPIPTQEEENEEMNIGSYPVSKPRMFGYGFGLPICLLYAQFFGGSLTFRQVARIGSDVYLRLGFIHTNSERIKI
ncbi:unnamed protein product [Adineta steineri]|uniref:Protein-serine/threonine kinase n=1 Tax=Adineta steineri TaxID=433720 RepID=A0A813ZXK4_9BILA|nr:unnamed protein product [Adineta steineri]CAF1047077.1 unnamed protein product [Adineta steineri]